MSTYTYTNTYTRTRVDVIGQHFKLFLKCAGMPDSQIQKMLDAVKKKQIGAIGVYIEDEGYRIYEVELRIDWELHRQMVSIHGDKFNTDRPGWSDDSVSPEAYVAVQDLIETAKEMHKPVHSWIIGSKEIQRNEKFYRRVCQQLGYSFDKPIAPWKGEAKENTRKVRYLEEAKVIQRYSG